MKWMINNKLRKCMISIFSISILIFIYLIYNKAFIPVYEVQQKPVYSYNNIGLINYNVYLKDNNLYNSNKLDEGKLYLSELVNYIDTRVKYEFNGEREASISGEYNITAKVKGFTGDGEGIVSIWEKDFPIIQDKTFSSDKGKLSINENVIMNIKDYNNFVKEIIESTKINCQASLTLSLDIKLNGITDKGNIEENISTYITFPLNVSMFEITKSSIDSTGSIEETIQVLKPINKNIVILYSVILLILSIVLIILIFFVKIAPEKEQHEKELKIIFRKYGDRLVALGLINENKNIYSDLLNNNSIYVHTIDDLIRISDELSKPIFYIYSKDYNDINSFFISNEDDKYIYCIKNHKTDELVEEVESISDKVKVN